MIHTLVLYSLALSCIIYGIYNVYYEQNIIYRGYLPVIIGFFIGLVAFIQEVPELYEPDLYEKVSYNKINDIVKNS